MASIVETAVSSTDTPGLTLALPYVKATASFILSSCLALTRFLLAALASIGRAAGHPLVIFSPFPVLLYILAPVVAFVQLVLEISVYTPYRVIVFLSDAFYPVYVFLGVACISGALLGLSGRLAVLGALQILAPQPPSPVEYAQKEKPRIR
ncbi:hypothetical protein B0H19DRAFT_1185841 [Mycena capillaripes]|nr:hypothetical protein B0H19DRAFT_1185841 [Mycena capillaripes]